MNNMTSEELRLMVNTRPMTFFQITAIGLCVVINMLDGFDVLVMSFAASSVSSEWGLSPSDLGILLSAGLIGMAVGSVWLGPYGDRFGRRRLVLACLVVITLGMLLSSQVADKYQLVGCRFFTGLGIGGMLATLNTMVSEFSNDRKRGLCISILQSAYPMGAIVGGIISVYMLSEFGWRSLFIFGGLSSLVMIPIAYWTLPESMDFLLSQGGKNSVDRINELSAKMALPNINATNSSEERKEVVKLRALLLQPYIQKTFSIWCAFFCLMFAFYYVVSWTPKLLVDAGLTTTQGISAGIYLQVGGILGAISLGVLSAEFDVKRLTAGYLVMSVVSMLVFGMAELSLLSLMVCASVTGFFLIGAMIGLYTIAPALYPVRQRVTGIGWAIGIGRVGAILSPLIGGILLSYGLSSSQSMVFFAFPLLIASVVVWRIRVVKNSL